MAQERREDILTSQQTEDEGWREEGLKGTLLFREEALRLQGQPFILDSQINTQKHITADQKDNGLGRGTHCLQSTAPTVREAMLPPFFVKLTSNTKHFVTFQMACW